MGFADWVSLGGPAALIKQGLQKYVFGSDDVSHNTLPKEEELKRRIKVNGMRKQTPCIFSDGLSEDEFRYIAYETGSRIKRIKDVTVDGPVITCTVNSITGYSDWTFIVDFNDWGHITGTYWPQTDNDDSSIPNHYGQTVSGIIQEYYKKFGISLPDYSDLIDENTDLGTDHDYYYNVTKPLFEKIFSRSPTNLCVGTDSEEFVGEHYYAVISRFKKLCFKNIMAIGIKDINDKNYYFPYEVSEVSINGNNIFSSNSFFDQYSEVRIYYHAKQEIKMPFSVRDLKNKNYEYVSDLLEEKGYSNIYYRKIEDLLTGWIKKDGSVENVLICKNSNSVEEKTIEKGTSYLYDSEIVIEYHTFKY